MSDDQEDVEEVEAKVHFMSRRILEENRRHKLFSSLLDENTFYSVQN